MKVLIMTTGKTGSTALAYAIQSQLKGCEMFFEPPSLEIAPNLPDCCVVKFLRIEQWKKYQESFRFFDVLLLLTRHPFDQILSLLLYAPFDGHGFSDDTSALKYFNILKSKSENSSNYSIIDMISLFCQITDRKVNDFLEFSARIYTSYINCYCQSKESFHLIKYEDFIDGNLSKVEQLLGIKISSSVQVDPKFSRVKRSAKYGDWEKWFTDSDIVDMKKYYVNALDIFQYCIDRESNCLGDISYEQSAGYFIKVINQYRSIHSLPQFSPPKLSIQREGYFFDKALLAMRSGNFQDSLVFIDKAYSLNDSIKSFQDLRYKVEKMVLESKSP